MRWAWLTHMPKYLTQLCLSDCVVEAKSYIFSYLQLKSLLNLQYINGNLLNFKADTLHVIEVCLASQSASEKHNRKIKAHKPLRTS